MSESLAIVLTTVTTVAAAAALSQIFFGDYREGFRILYRWIVPIEVQNTDAQQPKEPEQGFSAQIAYVAVVVVLAFSCFIVSVLWLRGLLHK